MKKPICVLSLVIMVTAVCAQQPILQGLPKPSGTFSIGYHHFEWRDSARLEILSTEPQFRVVVADIWYPAEQAKQPPVLYMDTIPVFKAFGSRGLISFLGERGAATIRSGVVQTHATEDPRFHHSIGMAPVIFFSHGMGMITQLYTAQIEELVSHGYIVVALNHAYDAWLVPLSDGSAISFETMQRKAAGHSEEAHITYENKRLEWWAADIRFAMDKLGGLNAKSNRYPFAGHFDLSRIGAMGHSSGGRAAARACQLDQRIKSCADQDGVAMMLPFYTGTNGAGMTQPFLLFERDRNQPPTDADLESMHMSRKDVDSLVRQLRGAKQAALNSTGGSWRVLLNFDSSTHMSFSDLPVLEAKDSLALASACHVLQVTCRYTREFFDKTLMQARTPLYDDSLKLPYIDFIQRYGKANAW